MVRDRELIANIPVEAKIASSGLSEAQVNLIKPRLESEALRSYEIRPIPGSDLKALDLVLHEGASSEIKYFLNDEILRQFPLVTVGNLVLPDHQWKPNDAFYTNLVPQLLHHDYPTVMGRGGSIGFYHRRNQVGQKGRRTPIWVADAKVYWPRMLQWMSNQRPSGKEVTAMGEVQLWEEIDLLRTDPQAFMNDYSEEFDTKPFLQTAMTEWGIDPNSEDGRLVQLLNTKAPGVQDLAVRMQRDLKDIMLPIQLRHMMVAMLDNIRLVHGRGVDPELNAWWPSKEPELVDTNLDYLDKAA